MYATQQLASGATAYILSVRRANPYQYVVRYTTRRDCAPRETYVVAHDAHSAVAAFVAYR